MGKDESAVLARVVRTHEQDILADWMRDQGHRSRRDPVQEVENRRISREFLGAMSESLQVGTDVSNASWDGVREILDGFSGNQAAQGYSPSETATFVFSLKQPVFARLRAELT